MTSIVNGIINSTVGLLCSKLRDYAADKLNEGDLSDERCKQIVVRELDDIKSKIDSLSRKDLLSSLSFFKEGVTRLYISLEVSLQPCEKETNNGKSHVKHDESEAEGATAMGIEEFPITIANRDFLKSAFEVSEMIENLTIVSQDRYKLAKESFKDARRLATEAFNNMGLSVAERLLAGKLRIASRILESLEDMEAAVRDSLLYLKELQDLPAVQAMFSVWLNAGKRVTSRLRARFNQIERDSNIQSIQMINTLLLDLTFKFTTTKMGLFNWPMIKTDKVFYHPLLNDHALQKKIHEKEAQAPWCWKAAESITHRCALTSKGEFLSVDGDNIRKNYVSEIFCIIPSENNAYNLCRMLGVDENDNVYAMVQIRPHDQSQLNTRYKLFIFDKNGILKQDRLFEIDVAFGSSSVRFNKDGRIIIYHDVINAFYICNGKSATKAHKLVLPIDNLPYGMPPQFRFIISNKNELILIFTQSKSGHVKLAMYKVAMDGKLTSARYLPVKLQYPELAMVTSVVFDHVNETIVVCVMNVKPPYTVANMAIYGFSDAGELLYEFEICAGSQHRGGMVSHSNGTIALVGLDSAIMLQM